MNVIFLPRKAFLVAGCLYAGYWAIFFGSVAFLIISSYLKERGHQPPARPVPREMQQHHHK
jgi:hypothetical protein